MKHPLTLDAFADWVEKKDPMETYIWADGDNCACAQYAKSMGLLEHFHDSISSYCYLSDGSGSDFWQRANNLADYGGGYSHNPKTFGALGDRLRANIHCERNRHACLAE